MEWAPLLQNWRALQDLGMFDPKIHVHQQIQLAWLDIRQPMRRKMTEALEAYRSAAEKLLEPEPEQSLSSPTGSEIERLLCEGVARKSWIIPARAEAYADELSAAVAAFCRFVDHTVATYSDLQASVEELRSCEIGEPLTVALEQLQWGINALSLEANQAGEL